MAIWQLMTDLEASDLDHFKHKDALGFCEEVSMQEIAAEVQTPVYVYSKATLRKHLRRFKTAFAGYPTIPCFCGQSE